MLSDRPQNKSVSSLPEPIFSKKCRRTTTFWVIALVCISIWMFFLGLLIGRGTLPFLSNPLQSELIAQSTREIPDKPVSETAPVVTRIKFFEALKGSDLPEEDLPEPFDTSEAEVEIPASPSSTQTPKPQPASPATPEPAAVPKPQPTPPAKPVPVQAPKPQPVPSKPAPPVVSAPTPVAPVSGKWTLQIMATKSEAEAQRMIKKLSAKGYLTHIQKADIPGKGLMYRVQVGSYADRSQAEATLQNLKKDGYAPIIKAP